MRRAALCALPALLLLSATGYAQSGRPQPDSFRIEWTRRAAWMRPGVDGYVYNDSAWRVGNVRLRVRVVDDGGRVVRENFTWVLGDVIPGSRTFFVLPPLAAGESYRLSVESFDLVSRHELQGP